MNRRALNKFTFYLLSFTWGLPLTFAGSIAALVLRIIGFKPKRFGWVWYFDIGRGWGGCELGLFFVKAKDEGLHICRHEFGHAVQNCFFGPLMPFLVNLPSTIRYWYRRLAFRRGRRLRTDYDDIWFEGQATRLGTLYSEGFIDTLDA